MPNETLSIITRALELTLTALVSIAGTYFALRGRLRESEAMEKVAKIQNEDELMLAFAGLQQDWATTYRQLVKDVSKPMEQARAEIGLLRDELKAANDEIQKLRQEVNALRREDELKSRRITGLEQALEAEQKLTAALRSRINRIKDEIETGPFPSGPHKIPKDEDKK